MQRLTGPLSFHLPFLPVRYDRGRCCSVHSVYQLSEEAAAEDDEGEDNVPSYREWELPSAAFDTVCRRPSHISLRLTNVWCHDFLK